jgi:ribonuclease HI
MSDPVFIFCDGSHTTKTRIGAWGAIIRWRTYRWEIGGGMFAHNSEETELAAVLNALKAVPQGVPAIVFSDSQNIVLRHEKRFYREGVHLVWKRARCDDHMGAHSVANRYRREFALTLTTETV